MMLWKGKYNCKVEDTVLRNYIFADIHIARGASMPCELFDFVQTVVQRITKIGVIYPQKRKETLHLIL